MAEFYLQKYGFNLEQDELFFNPLVTPENPARPRFSLDSESQNQSASQEESEKSESVKADFPESNLIIVLA